MLASWTPGLETCSQASSPPHAPPSSICYGLNCVPRKDVKVLTPTTSECDLIWRYCSCRCS